MFYNNYTSKLQCNKSLKRHISEKAFLEVEERRLKDILVNHQLNIRSEARFKTINNTVDDCDGNNYGNNNSNPHSVRYGSDYDTDKDISEEPTEEEQEYLNLINSLQKKDVEAYKGESCSSLITFGSITPKTALTADLEELRDDVRKGYITDREYYKRLEELNRGE